MLALLLGERLKFGELQDLRPGNSLMLNRLLICCLFILGTSSAALATDYAVVVHPSNPVHEMTLADLGKMFRAKTVTWPNGHNITIVLRDPTSPGMKFVIEKVLGGTLEEGKLVLNDPSRKTTVPVVFATSDEEILKIVGANAGAIGIIDVYNITSGVKVVKIDDKQPFDPGYILKGH
jgi:ABC-type phosphate transport system substrate-binding protein